MLRRLCTATLATAMFCGLMTGAASQAGAGGRLDVVAENLVTPRGLTWDAHAGRVLVTEAGRGGPGPCAPGVGGYPACFGATGAITSYTPGKKRGTERIATGLPSVINEFSVLGLHDIDASRGRISVVFGLGGEMATRNGLGPAARGSRRPAPSTGRAVSTRSETFSRSSSGTTRTVPTSTPTRTGSSGFRAAPWWRRPAATTSCR